MLFRVHALGFIPGRRFFTAFEQLDRVTRHDGRDRVLVDELGMTVPPQQDAEIIKPSDHALQLYPVDQEDRERDFAFTDVIEKSVLQVLRTFGCHCRVPFFARVFQRETFVAQVLRKCIEAPLYPTQKRFKAQEPAIRWQAVLRCKHKLAPPGPKR